MLEYHDDSSRDGTTHGGDDHFSYVAGMFVMYGLVDIIDQGFECYLGGGWLLG